MEAIHIRSQDNNNPFEQEKPVTRGYFKLNKSGRKIILKLRGDFNSNNIDCVKASMKMTKSLHHRFFELDLNEVENITMQAMALLIINLKIIKGTGTDTKVIGLDEGKLKLANKLGMSFITQIN
jgi:ABC-type transporter Mla MlaB component